MTTPDDLLLSSILAEFPIVRYLVLGVIASCGAITRYLWDCLRGVSKFSIIGFLLYVIFGFFVGNLVGSFMPEEYAYRDGVLLLSGFVVKEIFELLQRKGAGGIAKFLKLDDTKGKK
tara:strand:- start:1958 stop:2308 length:351 start_codon:yes stop_codon:yes gene_type:complete